MAITFIQERKKQQRLVLILIAVVIITIVVVWFGFFRKPATPVTGGETQVAQVYRIPELDFFILENPIFRDLQPFDNIVPFVGEKGRTNPFLSY